MWFARSCAILSDSSATQGLKDSSRLGLLPMAARYSLAQWAHLRWTRMLLGRGAGNPLPRGSRGFRTVLGCRNHMNDLVAAAFELVENFGQREESIAHPSTSGDC